MRVGVLVLCALAFSQIVAAEEEEELVTIMLHSKDFIAHHPELGFINHHEMDENIPLLLQLDEATVRKHEVPAHCAPEVKFEDADGEGVTSASEFLQIKSALRPATPATPSQSQAQMDLNTLLPLAAGAYFMMNGGLNSLQSTLKASGVGSNEMMSAMPMLLGLGSQLMGAGGNNGGSSLGSLAQLAPMVLPMLTGGNGGAGGAGGMGQLMQMAPQLMQMMGGANGGGGGGNGGAGMGQLMQMAPQLMQMMGGAGGNGGGMGGNAAMAAQLLPMLMGGGGGGGMGGM